MLLTFPANSLRRLVGINRTRRCSIVEHNRLWLPGDHLFWYDNSIGVLKPQSKITDTNGGSILKPGFLYSGFANKSPVGRIQILDNHLFLANLNLAMLSRNGLMLQDEITAGITAQHSHSQRQFHRSVLSDEV